MLFKLTFLFALLATTTLGVPTSKQRMLSRLTSRLSLPKHMNNVSHPEFSSNWAGAVLNSDEVSKPRTRGNAHI